MVLSQYILKLSLRYIQRDTHTYKNSGHIAAHTQSQKKCVKSQIKTLNGEASLAVQGLHASNAGGVGLIPVRGTKISHAIQDSQKFF